MRRTSFIGALLPLLALLIGSLGPAMLLPYALDNTDLNVWFHGHDHTAGTPDHKHPTSQVPGSIATGTHVVATVVGSVPPVLPQVTSRFAGEGFPSASPPLSAFAVLRI